MKFLYTWLANQDFGKKGSHTDYVKVQNNIGTLLWPNEKKGTNNKYVT